MTSKELPQATATSCPSSTSISPPGMTAQSSQGLPLRRSKPQVYTTLPTIPAASYPASAISASSVTSSSQQPSPIMSPLPSQLITSNSSLQGSPEGPRGRDADIVLPPFELPESIVSRKPSQSTMSEALSGSKSTGIIRRLSNRASRLANRRRQSSTNANSRDHSSGPVIMRRRSDSNGTAPEVRGSLLSDSDDDIPEDARDELNMALGGDGLRDFSGSSTYGSTTCGSISGISAGPVIPSVLIQGTPMVKLSKKGRKKAVIFILDKDAAKVSWDKNRPSKCFYIDDIRDIRSGADARNYRLEFGIPAVDEPRFFSIFYTIPDKSKGSSQKMMHLIAGDDQTFELWTTMLDAISKHRERLMISLSAFNDRAVRTYWRREMDKQFADRPHSEDEEVIDLPGVESLCRNLHIHGVPYYLHASFAKADATGTGRLNFAEFQEFVRLMTRREDIRGIFQEHAKTSPKGITLEEFLGFLSGTQCEDVAANRAHWETVFYKFVRRSKPKDQCPQDVTDGETPLMTEATLTSFLTSTFNGPVTELPAQFSLDRPLHEYFISSSHNTYLLGRQVAGQSSVEAYISALTRGCRCVEVDCWNGSEGPVVMHGRTLTSQVSFVDVMTTISKYAFVKTAFPLWISLEVHCNDTQQAMMAQIIRETCGSMLVTEPIDPASDVLPSPSQLLNRILIKVKSPRTVDEAAVMDQSTSRSRGVSISSPFVRPTALDNSTVPATYLTSPQMSPHIRATRVGTKGQIRAGVESQDSFSSSTSDSESITSDSLKTYDGTQNKKKQSNIIKVLGALGVYSCGVKFHGFDSPESKQYNHVFSFMEQTFARNSKTPESKRALTRHNMRFLMRVYPNGWRVASTNFDPLTYWRRGVQMAALNWQTYDLGMQINDAMFAGGTDQSGYVLKPSGLREIQMLPNVPEEAGAGFAKRERKNVNFAIEVKSAQQLMRPKGFAPNRTIDPYVEVEVYHTDDKSKDFKAVVGEGGLDASNDRDGSSGLGTPHRRRTGIRLGNGFNPVFNSKFNFGLTTKSPELVFVRFTVRTARDGQYDEKATPLAVYTAKLSSLKQGYRTLPLMDNNGDQFLFSTLFCRIKIEPATSIYVNVAGQEAEESVGKLKSIGRSVFARTPMSPKTSVEGGYS
ncbi:MAG: Phospholipase C [Claussenomyces sp. TS43310]|nr:MAG: Phospholipase C [Claussenomyces sp. TS43310]